MQIPSILQNRWYNRIALWLDKRIPKSRDFHLDMRSIFIFPSGFGVLYLALCICLFILGTNYQNNLMLLMCYCLVALFLINLFVSYLNFATIHVRLGNVQNVHAGDPLRLPLWINAGPDSKKRPHGLLYLSRWRDSHKQCIDVDQQQNPSWLALSAPKRGRFELPRITLTSFYPLGLYRCWTHLAFEADILIYPTPLPCSINLQPGEHSGETEVASITTSGHDDFDGLKPYVNTDSLRHVAWKQVAKGQGMISKQFSSPKSQSGWLKLMPCPADELEKRLSQLTYQVIQLGQQNRVFGLDLGFRRISPDSGMAHEEACLAALAVFDWNEHA